MTGVLCKSPSAVDLKCAFLLFLENVDNLKCSNLTKCLTAYNYNEEEEE